MDQHIPRIENGYNKSWFGKSYHISGAALRTFNFYAGIAFLFFIYPSLNTSLMNPFGGSTTSIKIQKLNKLILPKFVQELTCKDVSMTLMDHLLRWQNKPNNFFRPNSVDFDPQQLDELLLLHLPD